MIEVEKKFLIDQAQQARLLVDAELVDKQEFTDVYYDTADFVLTRDDIWLRNRAGRFEVKYPVDISDAARHITQYEEIEDEGGIRKKLRMPEAGTFFEVLASMGYIPFAAVTTTRTKYKKEGFTIDVDRVDFGYAIVEIELMVREKKDAAAAYQKIIAFAESCGLTVSKKRIRGKVVEYIRRNNRNHFHALEQAWGVRL
jgi:predicted adenylyl cyclase CyaB